MLDLCGGSLTGKTIADLGCNEGGFAVEFARLGAKESVGIEARDISVQRCELVRKLAGLENLKFIRGDVMQELARWPDSFDVVFASGILYHVADPHRLLTDIFRACREAVLIDAAVASREAPSHWCSEEIVSRTFGGISYQGRVFPEPDASIRESQLWSAWSNESSFWAHGRRTALPDEERRIPRCPKGRPHPIWGPSLVRRPEEPHYRCRQEMTRTAALMISPAPPRRLPRRPLRRAPWGPLPSRAS